ncbi:MAG: hypothetical protein KF696_14260 [Planctomycetes bacterium]|nr:hypothetical protein [Planctomycetota bacterium]
MPRPTHCPDARVNSAKSNEPALDALPAGTRRLLPEHMEFLRGSDEVRLYSVSPKGVPKSGRTSLRELDSGLIDGQRAVYG